MNCPKCGKEIADGAEMSQDKGTLLFWVTLLFGSTGIQHFMLAKTGALDKKSRFIFNWEGAASISFAILGLFLVVLTGSADVGCLFWIILSVAAIVHAWRHAFGKICNYSGTVRYMGQKWKKVVCIVDAALILISVVCGIVFSSVAPSASAKAELSQIPLVEGEWVKLQEANAVQTKKVGDFATIGFSAASSEKIAFFEIPAGKRKDARGIGALLLEPMHKCPSQMVLAMTMQADSRNGETHSFCWAGLRNAENGNYEAMPAEQVDACLELVPSWKVLCGNGLVENFDGLFPAPLFEPLDMSEISKFLETARANEPQTEGDGFYLSSFVATLGKVMKALSPDVQEIDAKTFQTQNFIYKEESRNKRKNKVIWTAKSLRPVGECPEGSEWKITATQKPTRGEGMAFNYGYYVKSPEGCPKVKDLKETILSEW